ncbi:MAG: TIGR04348 family glycosyltransferase [Piscinibacter sp.]|nr:TIGR04348 family glycosyltransferase [Piscinibacter sp.]
MHRPRLVIVTPALAQANNGNWQTAHRWAGMLAGAYRVRVTADWDGGEADLLIALHARRSAGAVAAWRAAQAQRPLVLVLTGTDLYGDIAVDAAAQRSLALADRLVVLNELGPRALPPEHRAKARVLLQSCSSRHPLARATRHLRALMVGHLRDEKAPRTWFQAARLLQARDDILLDHVGMALDPALGAEARALAEECPRYRWLGGLPHEATRRRIQAAHVLVHASRVEGGAHVVIEALRSGTPVLASHIDGNLGLLGTDYRGTFPLGDAHALAALLRQARDEPAMLPGLRAQGDLRAPLFDPARESEALLGLLAELLTHCRPTGAHS